MWASLRCGHEGLRSLVASLETASRGGRPLSASLGQLPGQPFPSHELALLRAAEHTGSIGDALHQLADDLETRRRTGRGAEGRWSIRPAAAARRGARAEHGPALRRLLEWARARAQPCWCRSTSQSPAVWYALSRPTRAPGLARLALWIPGLRAVQVHSGYRAWFAGMHRMYASGLSLSDSSRESLGAVPNPVLRQRMARALAPLEQPQAARRCDRPALPWLSGELRVLLRTAETSGELEAALLHACAREAAAESSARLRFGRVAAAAAGAVAVAYVAARLILFYTAHFSSLLTLILLGSPAMRLEPIAEGLWGAAGKGALSRPATAGACHGGAFERRIAAGLLAGRGQRRTAGRGRALRSRAPPDRSQQIPPPVVRQDWARAFPAARTYAVPGLPEKRSDLRFNALLGDDGAGRMAQRVPAADLPRNAGLSTNWSCATRVRRSLIVSDLVFNVHEAEGALTPLLLRADGMWRRFGPSLAALATDAPQSCSGPRWPGADPRLGFRPGDPRSRRGAGERRQVRAR